MTTQSTAITEEAKQDSDNFILITIKNNSNENRVVKLFADDDSLSNPDIEITIDDSVEKYHAFRDDVDTKEKFSRNFMLCGNYFGTGIFEEEIIIQDYEGHEITNKTSRYAKHPIAYFSKYQQQADKALIVDEDNTPLFARTEIHIPIQANSTISIHPYPVDSPYEKHKMDEKYPKAPAEKFKHVFPIYIENTTDHYIRFSLKNTDYDNACKNNANGYPTGFSYPEGIKTSTGGNLLAFQQIMAMIGNSFRGKFFIDRFYCRKVTQLPEPLLEKVKSVLTTEELQALQSKLKSPSSNQLANAGWKIKNDKMDHMLHLGYDIFQYWLNFIDFDFESGKEKYKENPFYFNLTKTKQNEDEEWIFDTECELEFTIEPFTKVGLFCHFEGVENIHDSLKKAE